VARDTLMIADYQEVRIRHYHRRLDQVLGLDG
jgi:hypothetical protein